MLEIRLLGKYEVRRDGAPVEIPSRPARLLLAYLALSAGTLHPREKVAGLLWPESDESSARGNLRQALWRLRKAIGGEYLVSDKNVVALDCSAGCRMDFALLEDPADSELVEAVSAYEGDLLPGFYEDWVILERERLQAMFERNMQRLLDRQQQQGNWTDVLRWAEHWIAFGQVPEPAYRALMAAHGAQGDLSAVSAAYQRCLSALELEVGVEPSAETRALYNALLQGEMPEDLGQAPSTPPEPGLRPRHNLPQQSTPFIGRERELEDALELLSTGRLLTILGPGGMGKSRLALAVAEQVADQFRHGAYFVSLAPVESAGFLVQKIAEAIGFPLSTEELPERQLLRHLRTRQYLLLLDNFEHLLEGARLVSEILKSASEIVVLVTSRERLNLQEEALLRIDGLAYPQSLSEEEALDFDAVRLFVSSAHRLNPGLSLQKDDLKTVSQICELVGGMPLGILLATAWLDMLSPAEIVVEMRRSLDFLQAEWRDVPERHRSVRAAIESSWRRLAEEQRGLMARLAVFRGGFTFESAKAVTGASLRDVSGLVQKSLVRRDLDSGRYEIHELIRQFALEQPAEARELITRTHAAYYADYMESRWESLTGSRQLEALVEIEKDIENVRAAWRYWLRQRDARRIGQFLDSFWRAYEIRGWLSARTELYAAAVDRLRSIDIGSLDPEKAALVETVYARALGHLAFCMSHYGDVKRGLLFAQESVTILRRHQRFDYLALPLAILFWNAGYAGKQVATLDTDQVSLEIARQHSGAWMQAWLLSWQFVEAARLEDEDIEAVTRGLEDSYDRFQELGDRISATWSSIQLGSVAARRGYLAEARQYYQRALEVGEESNYGTGLAKATRYLGIVLTMMGDYQPAWLYLQKAIKISDDLGLTRDAFNAIYETAVLQTLSGDRLTAVRLLAFVQYHPLGQLTRSMSLWVKGIRERYCDVAQEYIQDLEQELPTTDFASAVEQGRDSALEEVAAGLLAL